MLQVFLAVLALVAAVHLAFSLKRAAGPSPPSERICSTSFIYVGMMGLF